jgi:hypothetical protein
MRRRRRSVLFEPVQHAGALHRIQGLSQLLSQLRILGLLDPLPQKRNLSGELLAPLAVRGLILFLGGAWRQVANWIR